MKKPTNRPAEGADLFDRDAALRQAGDDDEILRELAEVFLEQAPELVDRIRTSASAGEPSELRRAAHTMKGSATVFAAAPVAEAALRVETLAREERMEEADAAVEALEPLVERLVGELRSYLEV
ncbi:MAG: Hpt domain-containing protein [Gemmatimonadota bacterium]